MNLYSDYSKYLSQQPFEVLEKIFSFMSLDQLKQLGQDRSIREKMNFDSLGFSEIFLNITDDEEKKIIQRFHPIILQSFGIEVIRDKNKSFFSYTVAKVNNWAKNIRKIYEEDWDSLDFNKLEALILYSDLDTVQNIVWSDRVNFISRIEIEKLFQSLNNFDLQISDLSKRFQILVGSDRFRTMPLNEFIHFICLSCRLFKNPELLLIFLGQDFTFDKLSESENQHIYQLIQSFILSKRHDCIQIINDFGLIQTFLQYGGDFYDLFMQSIEARNQKIPNLLFSYFINELNIKNIPDGHNFLEDPAVVVDIIMALIRNTHQKCEFFFNKDILRVLNVLDIQNILKNAESSFRFDVSSKILANLPIDLMIDFSISSS